MTFFQGFLMTIACAGGGLLASGLVLGAGQLAYLATGSTAAALVTCVLALGVVGGLIVGIGERLR